MATLNLPSSSVIPAQAGIQSGGATTHPTKGADSPDQTLPTSIADISVAVSPSVINSATDLPVSGP